jgi:phage major head subunit gpT-like protein
MGQIVTSDIVKNLLPGLKTTFMAGWKGADLGWKQVATEVASTLPSENYAWLGQTPIVRQWVDERIPKGLSEYSYNIKNLKWETSIRVDAEVLEDEQYGQVKMRVGQMPAAVARHQNHLVYNMLTNGNTGLCYDGSNFFDTTHNEGLSGTQINKFTATPLTYTNYAALRAASMLFKDDTGELVGSKATALVVPAQLEGVARQILNSDFVVSDTVAAPQSNIWKGSAELIVVPWLTSATQWFLLDLNAYIKPIVFQNRVPVTFKALDGTSDSDNVFMRDAFLYGVRARYNVGYGDWRTAIGSF